METFLNNLSVSKSLSPVTIKSDLPAMAHSKIKLSFGPEHNNIFSDGVTFRAFFRICQMVSSISSLLNSNFARLRTVLISDNKSSEIIIQNLSSLSNSYIFLQVLLPIRALTNTLVSMTAVFIKLFTNLFTNFVNFGLCNSILFGIFTNLINNGIHPYCPKFLFKFFLFRRTHLFDNLFNLCLFNFNRNLWHNNHLPQDYIINKRNFPILLTPKLI